MKRLFMWGIAVLLSGMILLLNPMDVKAENYYWTEAEVKAEDGSITKVPGWYKIDRPSGEAGIKLESAPTDFKQGDSLIIDCMPDEECRTWLASLGGKLGNISNFYTGELQIGCLENTELMIEHLNAYNGKITVYGNINSCNVEWSDLKVNGNVENMRLGNEQSSTGEGDVWISGNVGKIDWYLKELRPDLVNYEYYVGFAGDVTVSGTVEAGNIYSVVYDESIDKKTWQITGNIGSCENGVFVMSAGTLSEQVVITEVTPQLGNYRFYYSCYEGMESAENRWMKEAVNADTNTHAYFETCEIEDIPAGASVTIYGTNAETPVVLNVDLEELYFVLEGGTSGYGDVTVNGNVNKMNVWITGKGGCDVNVTGNVGYLEIRYIYNPKYNINVGGTVTQGRSLINNIGWFICNDMQIITDGNWNPDLFIASTQKEGSLAYKPVVEEKVSEALDDKGVGEVVTITTENGENKTLVKSGKVIVGASSENTIINIQKNEKMQETLNSIQNIVSEETDKNVTAVPVCGVDINVNTYFKDVETGAAYVDGGVYQYEQVKELGEGKTISFTIKVPADQYDADATYTVVRNHVNTDGTTSMDILETKQDSDVLTFASDKFSTFVIVEITEDESAAEENYVYTFTCQDGTAGDGYNRWTKRANDAETGKFIYSESCTIDDIEENSDVIILSTDKTLPVVIEKNLNKLNVSANAESVVTLIGNVADLTITDMAAIYDVKIEGDVGTLKIAQFHSGENNLTITGKVLEGITHSTRMPSMGFFECENMEIIQDGKWNSNLFIRANLYDKSVAYKPYQYDELESALDGLGLGEETTINTPTGSTLTAFKTAAVSVSETKNEVFENMKQSEECRVNHRIQVMQKKRKR